MSCCANLPAALPALPDDFASATEASGGTLRLLLHSPDISCAACISRIERQVEALPFPVTARTNFTRRTIELTASGDNADAALAAAIARLRTQGYRVRAAVAAKDTDPVGRELLRALAVAGFGAMNVMLLSVAVWAGAEGSTRALLTWFAALVALPTLAYSARPFVRSAVRAVRGGSLNMDVPIALAIVLAAGLSIVETLNAGETYFDAAVTLTFFLLAGRVLDHHTRMRARASIASLAALEPQTAARIDDGGDTVRVPLAELNVGDTIVVNAGERVPVDATLASSASAAPGTRRHADFDLSLATGEAAAVRKGDGEAVVAGAIALAGPVALTVAAPAAESFIARLRALQQAAESSASRPARLADRAARVYAPVVHLLALATAIGWLVAGLPAAEAVTIAIAVLIITCPCALGLAIPVVHVAACDRLYRMGIAVKDGTALERLRNVDEVVFDKTGTLTIPTLQAADLDARALAEAAALARHSSHPMAQAVVAAAQRRNVATVTASAIEERPGRGIEGVIDGTRCFLGQGAPPFAGPASAGLALHREGAARLDLQVEERPREGAAKLTGALAAGNVPLTLLSGDRAERVEALAATLGIRRWRAGVAPADKLAFIRERRRLGHQPLMVGDGINDGPALAAAHVSAAPAEAADLSRSAADLVVLRDDLAVLADALAVARKAHRLIVQNLAIAATYNAIAIPLAVFGFASPLLAALAMSTSSILVILNGLRVCAARPVIGTAPAIAPPIIAPPPIASPGIASPGIASPNPAPLGAASSQGAPAAGVPAMVTP